METKRNELSQVDRRRVALEALCDERSVDKYLAGGVMREMLRERIEAALRKLGFGGAVREGAAS